MTKNFIFSVALCASALAMNSCSKNQSGKSTPNDGQLHGVATSSRWTPTRPIGMVYVPSGTFHMGSSDEDINYTYTARNKSVSISGFWMDATEITNNEYRMFTNWVKDSIAAKLLNNVKQNTADGTEAVDWKKMSTVKWGDKSTIEKIDAIIVTPDNRIFGKKEIDANKIVYQSEIFDYKAAAMNKDVTIPRSAFIRKTQIKVYPDTLCWVRDFAYSYNEPMAKKYFGHPAFGNYPVVGVNWKQATAFCEWRTNYMNGYLESKKRTAESNFRLPT